MRSPTQQQPSKKGFHRDGQPTAGPAHSDSTELRTPWPSVAGRREADAEHRPSARHAWGCDGAVQVITTARLDKMDPRPPIYCYMVQVRHDAKASPPSRSSEDRTGGRTSRANAAFKHFNHSPANSTALRAPLVPPNNNKKDSMRALPVPPVNPRGPSSVFTISGITPQNRRKTSERVAVFTAPSRVTLALWLAQLAPRSRGLAEAGRGSPRLPEARRSIRAANSGPPGKHEHAQSVWGGKPGSRLRRNVRWLK